MKLHNFSGGNKHELFFEEMNIKVLVHKNLINESARDMIQLKIVFLQGNFFPW